MTDNRKGQPEDDLNIDFGEFDPDPGPGAPPPPGGDDEFGFDAMPDPGRPVGSAPAKARAPEDDFKDLGAFGRDDDEESPVEEPVKAPVRAAPADDFGMDDDDVEVARASLSSRSDRRGDRSERDEPVFGDEDGEGDDDGFSGRGLRGSNREEGNGAGEDGDDLYSGEGDEDEEGEEPPKKAGFDLSKFILPAGGAVAALFVGFMGWSFFLKPILAPGNAPPANRALEQVGPRTAGPTSAPPVRTAEAPMAPASSAPSLPPLGSAPPVQPLRPAPQLPSAQPPAPPAPSVQTQSAPPPVQSAVATSRPDPELMDRVRQLEARLATLAAPQVGVSELQSKVRQLEERLAAAENRSVPAAPRPDVKVPYKPQVIDGYTLQGVNRGVAWVNGPRGLIEVKEGTDLGGAAGKVTGIQRYNKDFIVVTESGVIMRN